MSGTKFFTNEPARDLYGKFQSLLRGNANYFDILVGLNVDKLSAQITTDAAKKNFCTAVEKEFDTSDISAKVEHGTKFSDVTGGDSVITGSSNFSVAGLVNNLEFNVELKDFDDVKFSPDKFNQLWREGVLCPKILSTRLFPRRTCRRRKFSAR